MSSITETLRLLHPDDPVELRVITRSETWVGVYDDPRALESMVAALEAIKDPDRLPTGYYITLHRLKSSVQVTNRVRRGGSAVSDSDIDRYRFLPVDLDPVRPRDVPATDEEHAAAEAAGEGLWAALVLDRGWPNPVLMGDSGNGVHLLWRIDLPTSDKPVVKAALAALADRFNSNRVKIDTSVFNPSRIWRLYATMNRKDPEAPGRPQRRSDLIAAPMNAAPVPREKLEALAEAVKPPPRVAPQPAVDLRPGSRYVEAAVLGELERVLRAIPGDPVQGRNNSLNLAAFNMGSLVGAGLLEEGVALRALSEVATKVGLDPSEARKTIQSGLSSGIQQPRRVGR